jgi:hypothetical protein
MLLLLLLTAMHGCAPQPDWHAADAKNLTSAQSQQQLRAEQARNALASTLLGELTAALQQGDAAAAIEVCRDRAPAIAADVAKQHNLRIGRTAQKLRNPANQSPDWAVAHVASEASESTLLAGPHGQLGALYPIRLMPQCLQCHGKTDELSTEVKAALATSYGQDQATGFAAGDLRGWFWVEVPATN